MDSPGHYSETSETCFGTSPSRLDSWDLENLHYLQQKSSTNSSWRSYRSSSSSSEGPLERFITDSRENTIVCNSLSEDGRSLRQTSSDNELETRDEEVIPDKCEIKDMSLLLTRNNDAHSLQCKKISDDTAVVPNDCYLLDVLTIANEQVLKEETPDRIPSSIYRSNSPPDKLYRKFGDTIRHQNHHVHRRRRSSSRSDGSTSGASTPFSAVSSMSSTEDTELGYYIPSSNVRRQRQCSTTPSPTDEDCPLCPLCPAEELDSTFPRGGRMRRMSAHSSDQAVFSRCSSYSYSRCEGFRTKFRVDQKGQLVIDYSHNWEGLELYIAQLQLRSSSP